MRLPSWLKPSETPAVVLDPDREAEKKELQAELAQVVVTFGRRRSRVQSIAEAAVSSMRDGNR